LNLVLDNHFHAAVLLAAGFGIIAGNRRSFTHAGGARPGLGYPLIGEEGAHRIGAPLGQTEIRTFTADTVSMAFDGHIALRVLVEKPGKLAQTGGGAATEFRPAGGKEHITQGNDDPALSLLGVEFIQLSLQFRRLQTRGIGIVPGETGVSSGPLRVLTGTAGVAMGLIGLSRAGV